MFEMEDEEELLRGCEAAMAVPEVREYWEYNKFRTAEWWAGHIRTRTRRPRTLQQLAEQVASSFVHYPVIHQSQMSLCRSKFLDLHANTP